MGIHLYEAADRRQLLVDRCAKSLGKFDPRAVTDVQGLGSGLCTHALTTLSFPVWYFFIHPTGQVEAFRRDNNKWAHR